MAACRHLVGCIASKFPCEPAKQKTDTGHQCNALKKLHRQERAKRYMEHGIGTSL